MVSRNIIIYGLFNDAVCSSVYKASNNGMTNDELERIWKEAAVLYFWALAWHWPGGTEETHENPRSG
jgi:hypothetical protein